MWGHSPFGPKDPQFEGLFISRLCWFSGIKKIPPGPTPYDLSDNKEAMTLKKLALIFGLGGAFAATSSPAATTNIISDNYNVTATNSGFALNTGVNTGINPPTTRLTGTAKANLRYINTGTKATNAFTITGNALQVSAVTSPGRFVLSADGTTSFDFGPALGIASASSNTPVVYDLSIRMNNNSAGTQRFSLGLGTAEGDATTWDFGVQLYRTNSGNTYYTIGKRIDSASSGLGADVNDHITSLTPNTFGGDVTILMRVTDAGAETTTFNSRVQLSLNGGNSWFYDTAKDSDLSSGHWRFNGPERHIMWDVAGDAGPVTFDAFSLKVNPPTSNVNTSAVFRAMTYNIHFASGPDGKVNTQRIANFILDQNVDLVCLNEVARFMATRASGRDVIGELSIQTGMSFVFSNNNTALTGNDQFGNAILSKYPILLRDHRLLPVVGDNEQRGWLKAVVDLNGKFLSFWTTHLDFHADNTERLMCGTNLNTWLADETFPVLMGGDFNDTPDSPIYGLLDNKWTDVWPVAGDGSLGRTVPCPGPPFNARIDYLWQATKSSLTPTNAFVGYGVEASDHYPTLAQFVFPAFTNHVSGFYFPCDQGSGTKTLDAIGGLTAKFGSAGPTWSTNSPSGQPGDFSLFFDGTKTIVATDTNQIIGTNGLNDSYTLQAWVKLPLNYSPAERAVLFQYERRPGFSLSINTNRTLHTTTFGIKDITSTATIPNDGNWHHVAVVHTDGANMKFYVDASLAATVTYTNGAGFRTSSEITIGSDEVGTKTFTGYLDRIGFDSRALIPAQFDFPAVPALGTRTSGNLLTLFWGAGATNYSLQANDALQPVGWTNVPTQVQGTEIQSTIAITNTTKFFRLKHQ
jgi:endonuclease/exonuclease/phosphatase family metal-dependent hydrolase